MTSYGEPGRVTRLDDGLWAIDLGFQDRETVIYAYLIAVDDELALVETGPTTTLPRLLTGIETAGFAPSALTKIIVSHIHLDHSGGAGVLMRDHAPDAVIHVHPVGAPHLIDPAKLLASASRLYTGRMEMLWGEVAPIPTERVISLGDGEVFEVGGRPFTALFTPGHASHHVVIWDPLRAVLFTGDVGGVRMPGVPFVLPPAPPPEVDPGSWAVSVSRMQELGAERLLLTHGGLHEDAGPHLAQLMPNLDDLIGLVKGAVLAGAARDGVTAQIHDHLAARLGTDDPEILTNTEWAAPSSLAEAGLTRYLVKRGELPAPPKPA